MEISMESRKRPGIENYHKAFMTGCGEIGIKITGQWGVCVNGFR